MNARTTGPLWLGAEPLILASRSTARRALLSSCGIEAELLPVDLDERRLEADLTAKGAVPQFVARSLAGAKARAASQRQSKRHVLGADQVLAFGDHCWAKPASKEEAASRLAKLAGREHRLVSACAVARDDSLLYEGVDIAVLRMRELTPKEIGAYLELIGDEALASVGSYRIEGLGRLLFDDIEADHATILGLPLAGLTRYFRSAGLIRL
jgi:septum formation protein